MKKYFVLAFFSFLLFPFFPVVDLFEFFADFVVDGRGFFQFGFELFEFLPGYAGFFFLCLCLFSF